MSSFAPRCFPSEHGLRRRLDLVERERSSMEAALRALPVPHTYVSGTSRSALLSPEKCSYISSFSLLTSYSVVLQALDTIAQQKTSFDTLFEA